MRDLLPNEQTLRDYIQGKILETYRASLLRPEFS